MFRMLRRHHNVASTPRPNIPRFASKISIPFDAPLFPVIDECPSTSCSCRPVPPDLNIEREQNINGSMAAYAEHVLISTGKGDWASRIENDRDNALAGLLKSIIGPKGKFSDPYHNVMVTNSSLVSSPEQGGSPANTTSTTTSAYVLPSFKYIPRIPLTTSGVEDFARAFLLPHKLHPAHSNLSNDQQIALLRDPAQQQKFIGTRDVDEILVLICSHGQRDGRCGVMGPILKEEFEERLQQQGFLVGGGPTALETREENMATKSSTPSARVALISHIGGHKWAGNVIIYVPPQHTWNVLAGKGIWYGRVEPKHVEGIVQTTILKGAVIKSMFRGGIDRRDGILRL